MISLIESVGKKWFIRDDVEADFAQVETIRIHGKEEWLLSEFWKAKECRKLSLVGDIGFHIGTVSLTMAEALGSEGEIVAVEPEIQALTVGACSYAVQQEQFGPGVLAKVGITNAAIGGRSGSAKLKLFDNALAHSTVEQHSRPHEILEEVTVSQFSLEDWMGVCGVDRFDFLKVNCEGAEFDIFDNAPQHVMDRIGWMVCEPHPHFVKGRTTEELLCILTDFGFEVSMNHGNPMINAVREGF